MTPSSEQLLHGFAGAVTVAVGLLGLWLLSGLMWGFSSAAPAPVIGDERRPQSVAEVLASRPLFAAGLSAGSAAPDSGLRLLGVVAAGEQQLGRAIVRRDGEAQARVLALGDDAGGGATLRHIDAAGIVLVAGGRESRLNLPRPAAPATAATPEAE